MVHGWAQIDDGLGSRIGQKLCAINQPFCLDQKFVCTDVRPVRLAKSNYQRFHAFCDDYWSDDRTFHLVVGRNGNDGGLFSAAAVGDFPNHFSSFWLITLVYGRSSNQIWNSGSSRGWSILAFR